VSTGEISSTWTPDAKRTICWPAAVVAASPPWDEEGSATSLPRSVGDLSETPLHPAIWDGWGCVLGAAAWGHGWFGINGRAVSL
jgi:hypothetical protein